MGPSHSTRYLGVQFGAGRIGKVPAEQGKCDTTCLVGSALKPKQKIEFIQSFILPRWRHGLAFGRISIETYQKLDRHVRRALCKILHRPVNLSKEWIHLSIRMGGLGIPNVTEVTYLAKVRLMFDRLLTLVFGKLRYLFLNGNWRVPETSIPAHDQFPWEKWRKSTQGRGVETFTGRLNCKWLQDGSVTGDVVEEPLYSQVCCGPKPKCGESLVQGKGKSIPSCGEGAETISYILQNCRSTTHMRIRRHNMVIDVVKKRIRKEGYVVLNKRRVVSHEKDQLLRAGFCVKKDDKAMVLDAHVPCKTSAKRLAIARSDEIKKYAPHGDGFRRYLGCDDLKVDEVVVGARRAITQQMAANLSVLSLGPEEMDIVQKRAVEGSWEIFK